MACYSAPLVVLWIQKTMRWYSSSLLPFLEFLLEYLKAPPAATEQHPILCVLPTMTQVGCEHMTQCISFVHCNAVHIVPQRQTWSEVC